MSKLAKSWSVNMPKRTKARRNKPKHSPLGASSYYRWKSCPGSVRLCQGVESVQSEYAKEGSQAHEIAEDILNKKYFTMGERPTIPDQIPADMMAAIRVYTDLIHKEMNIAKAIVSKGHMLIEHRFAMPEIHEDLYGTADCVIYGPEDKKLRVIDYKHGAGIMVEAEDNLQLMYYALGALLSTGFPCEYVEIIICQPRCGLDNPVRRWKFETLDLLDFADQLQTDAKATEDPNAALCPGDHCRFCPAAATKCPALAQKSLALAQKEFSKTNYDPEELSDVLNKIPMLEAFVKKVREFAYQEAMRGAPPPGFKLVAKRPRRRFDASEDEVVDYMLNCGRAKNPDDCYKKELKSVSQMEKLISRYERPGFNKLVVSESSGLTLVPETDKRAEVSFDPKSQFDKIEA